MLTPHPLEAARLLGVASAEVQADRLRAAQALAERFGCVVLLKGSGSVIATPGRVPHINPTGNAALASAGTGDVLAGWIGGLWAQEGGAERAFASPPRPPMHTAQRPTRRVSRPLRAADLVESMFRL